MMVCTVTMQKALQEMYAQTDSSWTMRHTMALTDIEYKQTFKEYAESARYVYTLLQKEGFAAEMLSFPADGRTVYQDVRMPLAWEASIGRLTVTDAPIPFENPVVADYETMPFALIKHSVAAPAGGLRVPLVTESQVYAGEDCRGAMVLLEPETPPRSFSVSPLLDLGALGFVSDFLSGAMDTPDCVQWVNACTDDSAHWHVQAEDRDFIGFSVSPRVGRKLRQAATSGTVEVLVESDGRRYEGEIDAVTALIPGEDTRELWVFAHLYEPLSMDNSCGVMAAIGAVRQLRAMREKGLLPAQTFSIRLVFAMENYGFAAVAEHFGGALHDRVIGGINMDGIPVGKAKEQFMVILTPYASPFFGNYVFEQAMEAYCELFGQDSVLDWRVGYHDDTFLGDSTVGIPTIWPARGGARERSFWHNSIRDNAYLDEEKVRRVQSLFTLWIARMSTVSRAELPQLLDAAVKYAQKRLDDEAARCANDGVPAERLRFFLEGEQRRLRDFAKIAKIPEIEEAAGRLSIPPLSSDRQDTLWLSYAAGIVAGRVGNGFPFDLIRLPKQQRRSLPDDTLYGPMGIILSAMDGKRNLRQLICGALWECHRPVTEGAVKQYVDAVLFLADAGYLTVMNRGDIGQTDIANTLQRLGVIPGDVLLVHSSLSGCGHIAGGADTVIDAFCEAVGETGAVLMPSFTQSCVDLEGRLNKKRNFRPFSPDTADTIRTGAVPKAMLRRPGVRRSSHATHSWCGLGQKAAACLTSQRLLDPPASETSPMAKALSAGGKVILFGCGLGGNAFLHFLEDQAGADYLKNAVVQIKEPDGSIHTEVIHRYGSGCSDFDESPDLHAKFYQRAAARGLTIKQEKLGVGYVYAIELRQLYDIGMTLFAEDSHITLCDRPACSFCRGYR